MVIPTTRPQTMTTHDDDECDGGGGARVSGDGAGKRAAGSRALLAWEQLHRAKSSTVHSLGGRADASVVPPPPPLPPPPRMSTLHAPIPQPPSYSQGGGGVQL